jgi:hypothetical protein
VAFPKASAITVRARAFLNDTAVVGGAVFTDAVLLEPLNTAYDNLQEALALSGVALLTAEVQLNLGVGVTSLGPATTPALPSDYVAPHKLWEKPTGTDDRFAEIQLARDSLPDRDQGPALAFWQPLGNTIQFIGATRAVTVKLRYEKELPELTISPTDSDVLVPRSTNALALLTAAIASRARGVTHLATELEARSAAAVSLLVSSLNKHRQRAGARRRPYGRLRGGYRYIPI